MNEYVLKIAIKNAVREAIAFNKMTTYSFKVISDTEKDYDKLLSRYLEVLKNNNIRYKLEYDKYYRIGEQFRNTIYVQIDSKLFSLNDIYRIINVVKPVPISKF